MTQITIDNILLVEVPEAKECFVIGNVLHIKGIGKYAILPPGNWQFIGTTDELEGDDKIIIGVYMKENHVDFDKRYVVLISNKA